MQRLCPGISAGTLLRCGLAGRDVGVIWGVLRHLVGKRTGRAVKGLLGVVGNDGKVAVLLSVDAEFECSIGVVGS